MSRPTAKALPAYGPIFSRRKFLGLSSVGMLLASANGPLVAPMAAPASPRDNPYDIATWEALTGARLTLRAGAEDHHVAADRPVKRAGSAFTVVLANESFSAGTGTLRDGTYELEHSRTGRFPLFVVSAGPGRYVATFNNIDG